MQPPSELSEYPILWAGLRLRLSAATSLYTLSFIADWKSLGAREAGAAAGGRLFASPTREHKVELGVWDGREGRSSVFTGPQI